MLAYGRENALARVGDVPRSGISSVDAPDGLHETEPGERFDDAVSFVSQSAMTPTAS
jgi:hypothetical protein